MAYQNDPEPGKLKPGPIRDLLAKLNEARKGDEWLDTHTLSERLGWAFTVTRGRMQALENEGLCEHRTFGGISQWQGNDAGARLL